MSAQHLSRDINLLCDLFARLRAADPEAAHGTTLRWLEGNAESLSPYLRGRFAGGSGVPADGTVREPAVPVEPDRFRTLTFRQACAAVAAFEEVLG
ncbi:putative protein OS=Streptomyces microflavus OX=1919 GN=Smic_84070 PE=4 SV=1 [Streptomyces microflavus]